MIRVIAAFFLTLLPVALHAKCNGTDLRTQLTPQQSAQFAKQEARIPFSKGMFWVARKGDQSIYIVGTMHTGDARMNKVMRSVTPYVQKADLVVLEGSLKSFDKEFKKLPNKEELLTLQKPPYLDQLMNPAPWKKLTLYARLANMDVDTLKRLQPFVLSSTLPSAECDPLAWQSKRRGLDEKIERMAHRRRIPVLPLESVEQGVRLLTAAPLRDQVKKLELKLQSKPKNGDLATTLRNAYFDEDLTRGILVYRYFSYRDLKVSRNEVARLDRVQDEYLLNRRNKNWIPIILKRKEKTIFVAVGGAHLPGRAGVLNLLKSRGYKVQNIQSK